MMMPLSGFEDEVREEEQEDGCIGRFMILWTYTRHKFAY